MKNNEKPSICSICKGKCCQSASGYTIPTDFQEETTLHFLISLLESGNWSIDWLEGDPRYSIRDGEPKLNRCYALRVARVNDTGVFTKSFGGACVLWSLEKGCSLPFENRPIECRFLKPIRSMSCKSNGKYSKEYCAKRWIPYQDMLIEAGHRIEKSRTHSPS
ncbi:MAG: hypothetical protein Q8934_17130 [Bacillota bacterium]|nr:hypothetical protein [Bacillota bacterium]